MNSRNPSLRSDLTIFPPSGAVPMRVHNCDESVIILEGLGVAWIDGVEHDLVAGDATFIPTGVPHFFRNASAKEQTKILWTYASIDADRTLVGSGDRRRIDDEHEAAVVPR